jgi:hypothetical protein
LETILPADEVATIKADDRLRPPAERLSLTPLPPGMSMARSRYIRCCRPGNPRPAPPL